MPVISLPTAAMGPFGMPMVPGNGSSGGGGDPTFGGKSISQTGTAWVYDGPDANSAVDVFTGITWVDNGNKFIASIETAGSNNSYGLYQFTTTTPYSTQPADISFDSNFLTYNEIADADFSPQFIIFNDDGSKGYFGEDNEIFGFSMSTNYDLSTATGTGHTKTSIPNPGAPYGYGSMKDLRFNSDGTKMFVSEVSGNDCAILEFSLSSAYDVTTRSASPTATFDPTTSGNGDTTLNTIIFNSDGTKMYALGSGGLGGVKLLFEYDLSTGFDLTTMSYNNENLNLETLAGIDLATSIAFDDDYYKMTIADGNDGVIQFHWGTAPSGGGGSNALEDGWSLRSTFSGMSNERFYSIGDDSSNNFYASGYDAVDDTILVASYDKDGAYRWSYNAGGNGDRLYDTDVDTSGNMIAFGYTASTSPLKGIVVKHASDGTHQWTKTLSDGGSENWLPLAGTTDSSDNIYVTGATEAQSNSGNRLPFVVKINSSGVVQWVKKYDHGGQQSQPEGIALDSNGDIFISGRIHEPITGGGYSSGMVMKLSGTDGSVIWQKIYDDGETVNGYHNDQFQNCAVTPEGDVLTCGWTNTDYLGTYYGVVLKLSGTDGSIVWDRRTVEADGTKKIAVDSAGKIYTFTDSDCLFVYASDGTLEQEWKITASVSGDGYYLEDIYIDKNDNAVLTGFHYTSGSDPAQPFITKLPATIQAGTSGDFVITAQTKGDSAGGMTLNTHTSYSANTMSNVTTGTASSLTPSSVSATTTGPNTVTGVASGGGGTPQGWISTIEDELKGYGYTDVQLRSLDVDGNDNIVAAGDTGGGHTAVVRIKSDGTVLDAASFGTNSSGLVNRSVAVDTGNNIFTVGEGPSIWSGKDAHTMRLTSSLNKSYDDFFGEGYNDEHFDVTTVQANAFAVGESQSFAFNFSSDPKGHLVKYDNTGGVTKTLITSSQNRSYPQGISNDGTNLYVIAKDQNHMFVAKVSNSLNSVTWSKSWGSSSAETRIMDIDANTSGESAAYMYEGGKLRIAKIANNGDADWRKTWEKASTDHGDAYAGYDYSAGYGIKLLSNGSIVLRAGSMPWTTDSYRKSFYIIIFDSTGTVTVQKEFRIQGSGYFLGHATKAIVELSDGKIVTAVPYYTGSDWKNAVFKFDPTDTSTAINGTHGDWVISDITDGSTATDSTTYSNGSVILDSNMSMYFKSGYTGNANGFSVSSATVVEGTQLTLGGGGGGSSPVWYGDRGIFSGGSTNGDVIQYFDITTLGNSVDFGDLNASDNNRGSASNGTRAVISGGVSTPSKEEMYYITIHTAGNAQAFGDLLVKRYAHASFSDGTKGVIAGGNGGPSNSSINDIEYIAIDTLGNGTDFGDMLSARKAVSGAANSTRGIIFGGWAYDNTIEYITIATPGNSIDFGDLTNNPEYHGATGSATIAIVGGGDISPGGRTNTIQKVQFDTPGNATDFGDLTENKKRITATSNLTRAVFMGGSGGSGNGYQVNTIEYVTIATPGNAVDFGDLLSTNQLGSSTSGVPTSGGGGSSPSYFGDKALFAGSSNNNPGQIDTLDITTTGNATNFGSMGRYVYAMGAMSNGTRAVLAGGDNNVTAIEYVTFATYSAPVTFGSTLATGSSGSFGAVSDGTYGVYPANPNYNGNSLEYITIATTGNGTDFGDMYTAGDRRGGASDGTYGLLSGGRSGGANTTVTSTDRITIATPGNATDFGDNTQARMNISGMGDGTYAVFAGGLKITQPYAFYNNMEYFTVATPGNATDFGDLVTGKSDTGATNNATRGVIAGGSASGWQEQSSIDYITIATPSNATSFGNLPTTKAYTTGTSGT